MTNNSELRVWVCSRCRVEKPENEFCKDIHSPRGVTYYCKDCLKGRYGKMSVKQKMYYVNRHRRLYEENREKEQERNRIRGRERYKKGIVYFDKNKSQARQALNNAIATGEIIKPKNCSVCGNLDRLHGHHKDYSKPFEVKWLCSICHGKEHRKYA